MIISKTHLSESMEIAKKRVMNHFLLQNGLCRRCRRKEAVYESIGNALKETVLSWIINTIYKVLPLYVRTPLLDKDFRPSLEAFSGAITFNVRVHFKHYTSFQTEVFSWFLRSDNIQRPSLFQALHTPFQTEDFSRFGSVLRSDNIQRLSLFQTLQSLPDTNLRHK